MKGNDLLRGLDYVSDELAEEALTKRIKAPFTRFVLPIAASFAVVIAAFSLWPRYNAETPIAPEIVTPGANQTESVGEKKEYTLNFNRSDSQVARSLAIKGYFYEELTEERMEEILPQLAKEYQTEGRVDYSHVDGVTTILGIDARFKISGNDMRLTMSQGEIPKCYIISGEPIFSEIEGVKIEAGIYVTDKNSVGEQNYIYYADFKADDISYYAEYSGEKGEEKLFAEIIAKIILGGRGDFSSLENPVVPKLKDESLTQEQAYAEADFGAYLPRIGDGYGFNSATRFINQNRDDLYMSKSRYYDDISFRVSKVTDWDKERLVFEQDIELYDISLYPVPWDESMSYEMQEIVSNPLFKGEDLTLDMVQKREYVRGEEGDPSGNSVCMRFCVLYGDVMIEIMTEGIGARELFDELKKLPYN